MAVDALAHEPGAMDVRYSVRSPVGRLRPCARTQERPPGQIVQLSHTASGRPPGPLRSRAGSAPRRAGMLAGYRSGWAMVSITATMARISTSFSPGNTSTP